MPEMEKNLDHFGVFLGFVLCHVETGKAKMAVNQQTPAPLDALVAEPSAFASECCLRPESSWQLSLGQHVQLKDSGFLRKFLWYFFCLPLPSLCFPFFFYNSIVLLSFGAGAAWNRFLPTWRSMREWKLEKSD